LTNDLSDPNNYLVQIVSSDMATDEGAETTSPLDEVMAGIRRELVQRVAAQDRNANRDIYDALEDE
jgi:death-on-curing protein